MWAGGGGVNCVKTFHKQLRGREVLTGRGSVGLCVPCSSLNIYQWPEEPVIEPRRPQRSCNAQLSVRCRATAARWDQTLSHVGKTEHKIIEIIDSIGREEMEGMQECVWNRTVTRQNITHLFSVAKQRPANGALLH